MAHPHGLALRLLGALQDAHVPSLWRDVTDELDRRLAAGPWPSADTETRPPRPSKSPGRVVIGSGSLGNALSSSQAMSKLAAARARNSANRDLVAIQRHDEKCGFLFFPGDNRAQGSAGTNCQPDKKLATATRRRIQGLSLRGHRTGGVRQRRI